MSTQQIPPFTRDALALLFRQDNFQAFQQPGFPSHYWAPLLAACCGASRDEVFLLVPDDLVRMQDFWLLHLHSTGTKTLPARKVPLHPWLRQLGFVDFVEERRKSAPKKRLFAEYKAGRENAGMLFSRAFVRWIKTTVAALPEEQQPIFAEDFHFPSLRALFREELARTGLSPSTLHLLRGGEGDDAQAAAEIASIPIESCFPSLPPFTAMHNDSNP
ncbi:MAG: hypothetical protein AB7E77_03560 [Desulfobulbus sp.]